MFGFVDLDTVGIDLFDMQEVPNDEMILAKHVLVVMVRWMASNQKADLVYLPKWE